MASEAWLGRQVQGSRGASAGRGSPSVASAVGGNGVRVTGSLEIPQWLRVDKKEGARIS